MNLLRRIASQFRIGGYDGADISGDRRRPAPTSVAHEDTHANERKRLILSANARDLARNFTLAGWMIRKHTDFVCDFSFRGQTPDIGFNRELEAWWADATKPHNFDVAGRHSHRQAVRISECCRILDGDVGWLKLLGANRGLTQMIEGDRIFMPLGDMPTGDDPNSWVNGVKIDPRTGRAKAYAISNRVGKSGKQLDRIVSARSLILHANYENRFDQVRGVSPLAAALNQLRDVYESIDYELAKQKLNSLFALAIMRETGAQDGPTLGGATYSTNGEGQAVDPVIDMMKGPTVLELQPGESASVLESHTPSTETVAFLQLLLQISLRALDIPFSAFSENFTNFFGSRSALIHYLLACDKHIAALQALQDAHFKWRVGIAVEDGELILPSGRDFEFIQWQFQPGGIPWWSPENEARGAAMSIAMGVTSPQRVCREIGTDFERNIDEIAEAMQYAASKGVPLVFADSGAFNPAITVGATNE